MTYLSDEVIHSNYLDQFHTVSEINGDFGRNSENFPHIYFPPTYIDAFAEVLPTGIL